MKAFVLTGPGRSEVQDLAPPVPMPGEAVIDVARVGVCGTDVEFFTGEMQYLHDGHSKFPLYLGHEWCGTVSAVGADQDDRWVGRRVTGDTMPVSYTHLRAHETVLDLVCRLLLEKKNPVINDE